MITVTCRGGCRDEGGAPRVWRENCQECAESTAEAHRGATGHAVQVHQSTSFREFVADPAVRYMFRKRGA